MNDRFYTEQCRTNFLLTQILEELRVANARTKPREKGKPVKVGDGPPETQLPLIAIWNGYAERAGLAPVRALDPNGLRYKAAKARWETKPVIEFWVTVVQRICVSRFCRGFNERKWKASFDFLVRPDTAAKVLEGQYDDKGGRPAEAAVDL